MAENNEDDLKFSVQPPIGFIGQRGRNTVQIRFQIAPSSLPAPRPRQPEIHVEMTLETAALLLAGLKSIESQLDMAGIQVEMTLVPPAKDRN